jgi:hypothetical protein
MRKRAKREMIAPQKPRRFARLAQDDEAKREIA